MGWTGNGDLKWYENATHTVQYSVPTILPTADKTLYGRFDSEVPKELRSVTLVRLKTGKVKTFVVDKGDEFTLPSPDSLGWTGGTGWKWYLNADHTNEHTGLTVTVNDYVTLYGRYDSDIPKEYWTVTLLNLAQSKMKPYTVEKGTTFTLPPGDLGWTGGGALKWYLNADHTNQHTGNITPTADTILYGQFDGDIPPPPK